MNRALVPEIFIKPKLPQTLRTLVFATRLGLAEEGLLKDILLSNGGIRPGYETAVVQTAEGGAITGILKNDGATSLELALPNGVEQALLRKDVTGVRRLATSLMPSFAEALPPADAANVPAWLINPHWLFMN